MCDTPQIDILVPYATKNYITNPSLENSTDGWNAVGSTLSAVLTRARFGRKSLQVVTNDASVNEGTYFRISDTSLKGVVFGSIYIRGSGKVRIRLKDGLTGRQSVSLAVDIHDEYWQRLSVQGIAEGSDDLRLYVETADSSQLVTFYIDGAQVERTDYLTTYCDGDQDDCRWNGVKHASTSERDGDTPLGGRWVNVREDENDPDTYVTAFSGLGLPPITINRQRMALSPGSFFDSSRTEERVIQFTVNIKDRHAQKRYGNSKRGIHTLRQHLTDLIKPDRDPNSEPMWMRYRDGDRSLWIRVLYESGLEFEGDFRNKWINTIPLRFLALDPFWYEDSQEVATLDTETELDDVFVIARRNNGEWEALQEDIGDTGGTQLIYNFAKDENENIYFVGSFIQDGDGNNLRYVGKLNNDYTNISEPASGFTAVANDVIAHPNGKIYICGQFQTDGDLNAYNRIVEYDPDADTFSALGSGFDSIAFGMDVAPNGDLYVVGQFTTAGGVAAPAVAKWDGGTWERVGDIQNDFGFVVSAAERALYDIVVVDTDEIYARGLIGDGSSTRYYAIEFNGTSWSELGDSSVLVGGTQRAKMVLDQNGNIITSSSETNDTVFRWNGSSYEQLGNEFTRTDAGGAIYNITIDKDGKILVAGRFTKNGEINLSSGIAIWNGSTWTQYDIDIPTTSACYALLVMDSGDIFAGFSASSKPLGANSSGIEYIEVKSTAYTFPIVTFEGSQRLLWLENQTTDQVVYMNYDVQVAERLELDFRTGIKSVKSNYRGNVPDAILPASSDFSLAPSDIDGDKQNKIACFSIDEVDPVVQLRYQPTHWSVDAISKQ